MSENKYRWFKCECGNVSCRVGLFLTNSEYDPLHDVGYIVCGQHAQPDAEERLPGVWVDPFEDIVD